MQKAAGAPGIAGMRSDLVGVLEREAGRQEVCPVAESMQEVQRVVFCFACAYMEKYPGSEWRALRTLAERENEKRRSGEGESVDDATLSTTLQRGNVGLAVPHNMHNEGLDLRNQSEASFVGVNR